MLSIAVIVYWDALALKTRLSRLTMTLLLMTSVTFDVPNVATSDVPFGTVFGLQFAAVFQSPLVGLVAQVALPARECRCVAENSSAAAMTKGNLLIQVLIDRVVGMIAC